MNPIDTRLVLPTAANSSEAATAQAEAEAAAKATALAHKGPAVVTDALGAPVMLAANTSAPIASTPVLPRAEETAQSTSQATRAVNILDNFSGDISSSSLAYSILLQASQKVQVLSSQIKQFSQKALNAAKVAQLSSLQEQIKSERGAAVVNFVGSTLGAIAGAGAGARGAYLRTVDPSGTNKMASALDSAGQSIGGMASSLVTMIDKVGGYAHDVDEARIAQKRDDVAISVAQQIYDGAKAQYDTADRAVDSAMTSLAEYFRRKSATEDNIANH